MSKSVFTLPPAPNWFSSSLVSASHVSGWVVYAAKNCLVLLHPKKGEDSVAGSYPHVVIKTDVQGERSKVTAVCWCPVEGGGPQGQNLVSGGEDGVVRVWSWNEDTTCLTMMGQHTQGKGRVTGASWSKADPGIVVTSDEGGILSVWDLVTNTTRSLMYGKTMIYCLACHPDDPDQVAVGCKLGLVLIVSLAGTGRVIHRMRGHDEDVYGLSWSPSMHVMIGEEEFKEWMLASSSRDRSVRVWSSREGRTVHSVRLPQDRQRQGDRNTWVSVAWPVSGVILSSGQSGELISWDLTKPGKRGGSEYSILHKEHFKNLFSISCTSDMVYTVGQDRSLVATSLSSSSLVFSLPCFAGFVYCMASNPIEPSTIAIGAGDGQIRVWRTGSTEMFSMNYIHAKMNQSKVMSLAWHPHREGMLAFGTDEGRVGWVEALGKGRMPTLSSYQHRGGVYSVTWGQGVEGEEKDQVMLYSCGDGKVVQHCTKSGKGLDIQVAIDRANTVGGKVSGKSQVVWMESEQVKLLLLGCDDGTIEIYNVPSLHLVATVKSQSKLIQSLSLHPQHMADGQLSKYSSFLASASNEFPIHIFDLSPIMNLSTSATTPLVLVSPTIILSGHLQRVIEVAWSTHTQARLVSVSYDFSGQVWDVAAGLPLHNFRGHSGRVMCCLWHPSINMAGVVITGGEDGVLHGWDPTLQESILPIERKKEKKGRGNRELAKEAKEDTIKVESVGSELSFEDLLAKHRTEQGKPREGRVGQEIGAGVETRDAVEAKTKEKKTRSASKKFYFPVSSTLEVKRKSHAAEDCLAVDELHQKMKRTLERDAAGETDLAQALEEIQLDKEKEKPPTYLGFFHSRSGMYSLLEEESLALSGDLESQAVLGLWTGNLASVVETALQEGKLTERLVSHCAGVSMRLWRRAAEGLGRQLVREGEVLRGSEHLLASGGVVEAVTVLSKHGYHRASVAIARSRLGQDCTLLREVMSTWARQSSADGNYGLAAKCWLAIGQREDAAELLARIGDRESLRVAALLVGEMGGKGELYSRQCLTDCLYSGDITLAKKLVDDQKDKLGWALVLCLVHREVMRLVGGRQNKEAVQTTLREVKAECDTLGYSWSQSNLVTMKNFISSSSHPTPLTQALLSVSAFLAQAIFPQTEYQACVTLLASALHLLHPWPKQLALLFHGLLPGGGQAPSVGQAVLGKELDLQCNWAELRSVQCSEGLVKLERLEKEKQEKVGEEDLELLADCFMLEDIIHSQKLEAEIKEGQKEVDKFKAEVTGTDHPVDTNKARPSANSDESLDLTPSLSGTQTLSLTGPGGEWKSEGVSDNVPLPDTGDKDLPPPPPPSRSFHQRFLVGQPDTVMAVKELQKLRWTLDKTSSTSINIFPDLTSACKRFVLITVERGMASIEDPLGEEEKASKLGLRQKVSRWGYYHGKREMQEFFIQHS